jgi:hypothetical protein
MVACPSMMFQNFLEACVSKTKARVTSDRAGFGALLIAAGWAFASGAPASAQGSAVPLVIRVEGPISRSIPAGKPLPLDHSFQLGPSDEVTLLGPRGVRVLQGPGLLDGENYTPHDPPQTATGRVRLPGSRGWDLPPVADNQAPSASVTDPEGRPVEQQPQPPTGSDMNRIA